MKDGVKGARAPDPDEKEVEKTFWLSNNGEEAHTHLGGSERLGGGTGMGGGSFASGRRTTFDQGKRVVRDHEDVWD